MDVPTGTTAVEVPAGAGRAVGVSAGDRVRIVDPDGGQVGDVFAFTGTEHHSAAHTRSATGRLFPAIGEHFVTQWRRPILTLVEDTSPGQHDMLIAACDPQRYAALGATGHRSCADNLREALVAIGHDYAGSTPQPINVFMRVEVEPDGGLRWFPASTAPGDAITFEAVTDCIVVVSACPQDIVGINAGGLSPLVIQLRPAA